MSLPLLEVCELAVDIQTPAGRLHAVRDISFDLARGETLAIVGESGCGKSMTSLALMNLLPAKARRRGSRLRFKGRDLLTMREREMADLRGAEIAMISQDPMTALNPAYTVGNQLVEVFRRHRQGTRDQARDRALQMLDRVGIPAPAQRMGQYPHQLSGGLRQRVTIAMALMCEPDVLIADEPTTALDVTIQAQILRLLAGLQKELGMGLILISHDLGVVARVADRVLVIYGGHVVETATAEALFARPLHPYSEGLLRAIPTPGTIPPGTRLGTVPGVVTPQYGELRECVFAPRCPYVMDRCHKGPIALTRAAPAHAYRCLLPADGSGRTREVWLQQAEAAQ